MPLDDYLIGVAFFGGTVGSATGAGVLVALRRLPQLSGAARVLAVALLATAAVLAAHLVPGALGMLTRGTALAAAVAMLVAAWRLRAREAPEAPPPAPARPSGTASWVLAGMSAAALGVWHLAQTAALSGAPAHDIDSLTFHLPNIASWIQADTFWRVDQFTPLLANGNYPQNGDVLYLAIVQPWMNDAFVRVASVPFVALTALAVYALASELRVPRATAVLAGALFVSLPVVTFAAYDGAKTDAMGLFAFGAGLLFLARHSRVGGSGELLLAGLGLGIAFGTKWYMVLAVPAVVLVWLLASLAGRRGLGAILRSAAILTGVVLLAGGFWLVRNWVESGDPFFPVSVRVAGLTIFDAPRDFIRECAGFRIVDYLGSPGIWADFILPAYRDNYGAPGLAIALGVLAALLLLAGADGRVPALAAADGRVSALAAATLLTAACYAITPYTAFGLEDEPILVGANTRWATPALLLAVTLAAWAAGRAGRLRVPAELAAALAVADGLRRGFEVSAGRVALAGLALVLLAAGVWLARRTPVRRLVRERAVLAVTLVLLGLGLVLALGHERQRRFNDGRYLDADAVIRTLARDAPEGRRIGLAGNWSVHGLSPVWPAFGPRLENRVEYVGERVDGQLREYADRERFVAAVRRAGYDLLVVGRGGYPEGCPLPGEETDDDEFARASGGREIASTGRLTLYAVEADTAR
jgi:hypothetical protein